jgi:hypothetical protein
MATQRRLPAKEDAGIVPLGIPMLAGPGAISSVMVLVGQVPSPLALGDGRDSRLDHAHHASSATGCWPGRGGSAR